MAKRFKRTRRGIVARLEENEIALLARLFDDVGELLAPDSTGDTAAPEWAADLGLADLIHVGGESSQTPEDPAVRRLLPDGRHDDPAAAAEFRRFTERGLRERKRDALVSASSSLRRWAGDPEQAQVLDADEARAWLASLTDVRLVLAQRLGIESDADAEAQHLRDLGDADPEDPQVWLAVVYDFTTWVQESLTQAVIGGLPSRGDGRRQPPSVED